MVCDAACSANRVTPVDVRNPPPTINLRTPVIVQNNVVFACETVLGADRNTSTRVRFVLSAASRYIQGLTTVSVSPR